MYMGAYDVKVAVGSMPEKIATAFGDILGNLVGSTYVPIAYLGSQVVNGVNHAVLAEQTIITGTDSKNIVTVIFNEKPEGITLVGIESVLESGGLKGELSQLDKLIYTPCRIDMGGTVIAPATEFPEDAKTALDEALEGFVGTGIKPFAYLGFQVVNGVNYFFAAEMDPMVAAKYAHKYVSMVIANSNGTVEFKTILA